MNRSGHGRSSRWSGAALLVALSSLLLAAGPGGSGQPVQPAQPGAAGRPLESAPCSLRVMVEDLRGALADGSPSLQRYMLTLLKEAALRMPVDELRAAFAAERDPKVLEALGIALATRASNTGEPAVIESIVDRARGDADPALRAAALSGLRGVGSVEMMNKARGATYADFLRDPAPAVRAAAVDKLVHEDAQVYFGHEGPVSDAAVKAAAASSDPALAARLLAEVSMEAAGPESVATLVQQLGSADPTLRAAAARALGGVGGAHSETARRALVERYGADDAREVRVAILEGLVQLGLGGARPVLESLRGVDPELGPEIDAWLQVLAMNLQQWSIILREKQRLRP
ncbi:MAG TPA: HEAT repeat domain-containing protein [Kofleriaceae bacterium]|nr:HEAT repeat domain-containing protein [Kofleriaceae bacterium]